MCNYRKISIAEVDGSSGELFKKSVYSADMIEVRMRKENCLKSGSVLTDFCGYLRRVGTGVNDESFLFVEKDC